MEELEQECGGIEEDWDFSGPGMEELEQECGGIEEDWDFSDPGDALIAECEDSDERSSGNDHPSRLGRSPSWLWLAK